MHNYVYEALQLFIGLLFSAGHSMRLQEILDYGLILFSLLFKWGSSVLNSNSDGQFNYCERRSDFSLNLWSQKRNRVHILGCAVVLACEISAPYYNGCVSMVAKLLWRYLYNIFQAVSQSILEIVFPFSFSICDNILLNITYICHMVAYL